MVAKSGHTRLDGLRGVAFCLVHFRLNLVQFGLGGLLCFDLV